MLGRLAGVLLVSIAGVGASQSAADMGPPVPYVDTGACPFEGCVYRTWTAKTRVPIRSARRRDARIAFVLHAREKVTAINGVVVTREAGRAEFRQPVDIETASGRLHIEPGQTLFLLTYEGEGYTKAWFNGRLYRGVDTVTFYNGVCDVRPERCGGRVTRKADVEWWVQVRDRAGRVGWTDEPEQFDGKDALSGHGPAS